MSKANKELIKKLRSSNSDDIKTMLKDEKKALALSRLEPKVEKYDFSKKSKIKKRIAIMLTILRQLSNEDSSSNPVKE